MCIVNNFVLFIALTELFEQGMELLKELGTDNVVHDRRKVLLLSC